VLLQAALGVATLLMVVPLDVALTHQFGAAIVLIAAVSHRRALSSPIPIES
jgi:heme a synthase